MHLHTLYIVHCTGGQRQAQLWCGACEGPQEQRLEAGHLGPHRLLCQRGGDTRRLPPVTHSHCSQEGASAVKGHCTLHTAHYLLHTVHCTLHTATAHCTLYTTHCTLQTVHYTLQIAYCTLHTAQCILHTATAHFHYTLHNEHSTLAAHYTLHSAMEYCTALHCDLRCTLHCDFQCVMSCALQCALHCALYHCSALCSVLTFAQNIQFEFMHLSTLSGRDD